MAFISGPWIVGFGTQREWVMPFLATKCPCHPPSWRRTHPTDAPREQQFSWSCSEVGCGAPVHANSGCTGGWVAEIDSSKIQSKPGIVRTFALMCCIGLRSAASPVRCRDNSERLPFLSSWHQAARSSTMPACSVFDDRFPSTPSRYKPELSSVPERRNPPRSTTRKLAVVAAHPWMCSAP